MGADYSGPGTQELVGLRGIVAADGPKSDKLLMPVAFFDQ